MDFQDLNNKVAEIKSDLIQKVEGGMGEIFIELSRLYGEIKVRSEVYQELDRLRAENAALVQQRREDVQTIRDLQAQLKGGRKEG